MKYYNDGDTFLRIQNEAEILKQTSMSTYNIMNSYNPQRAHPFSIIYIMKRASTHNKHDIHNISTTRFPHIRGFPAAEPDTHDV